MNLVCRECRLIAKGDASQLGIRARCFARIRDVGTPSGQENDQQKASFCLPCGSPLPSPGADARWAQKCWSSLTVGTTKPFETSTKRSFSETSSTSGTTSPAFTSTCRRSRRNTNWLAERLQFVRRMRLGVQFKQRGHSSGVNGLAHNRSVPGAGAPGTPPSSSQAAAARLNRCFRDREGRTWDSIARCNRLSSSVTADVAVWALNRLNAPWGKQLATSCLNCITTLAEPANRG